MTRDDPGYAEYQYQQAEDDEARHQEAASAASEAESKALEEEAMSEQTVDQQIAEIHQRLAEWTKPCSAVWGEFELMGAQERGLVHYQICGCHGTGKVPLLPKLRQPCEHCCINGSNLMDNGLPAPCTICRGRGWVLSDSDTCILDDALEERYGKVDIEVRWFGYKEDYGVSIKSFTFVSYGVAYNRDRRLVQWLAAQDLVTNMQKEEGAK